MALIAPLLSMQGTPLGYTLQRASVPWRSERFQHQVDFSEGKRFGLHLDSGALSPVLGSPECAAVLAGRWSELEALGTWRYYFLQTYEEER